MTAAAYAAVNGTAGVKRDPFKLFTGREVEKNLGTKNEKNKSQFEVWKCLSEKA